MDLLGLETFCAVVDEGGVLAASRTLHTVQSNVTTRIKRLEEELGAKVFFRKGRGLSLTPAGRVLLDYARKMLQLERQAVQAVKQLADEAGEVRIGTMESFAAVRLPDLLLRLRQQCPKVETRIQTDTSESLIRKVLSHELDCAYIGGSFEHDDLICTEVATEQLVLVKSKTLHCMNTLIVFREGCAYRERAHRWQRTYGTSFDLMEMGTLEGILGCVAFGLGVTLMPVSVVEKSQHREQLIYEEIDQQFACIPTLLIRHKRLSRLLGVEVLRQPLGVLN